MSVDEMTWNDDAVERLLASAADGQAVAPSAADLRRRAVRQNRGRALGFVALVLIGGTGYLLATRSSDTSVAAGAQATAPANDAADALSSTSLPSSYQEPEVVEVEGIEVNADIAEAVAALLAKARADGINLAGSGYRPIEDKIEMRRQNCGATDEAIWNMEASECDPPTAKPGTSAHEFGLAIDFTCDGALVTTQDPCFQWLEANAARYGLAALPSEPWHWSANGR